MTNLNASEKSKGVVIFATNTATIDYLAIARHAEQLINHYLKLPVTIISNDTTTTTNQRYNIDTGQFDLWNNSLRCQAYELSPYDQTILLDSDYFVLDDSLLKLLDSVEDYKIIRNNIYIDGAPSDTLGKYSIPSLWATIIAFDRTPKSKMLFDLVARVERNYSYYRRLYNIQATNFRNDFAFTIADNILNGYCQDPTNYIPWPMLSVNTPIDSLELQGSKLYIKTKDQAYVTPKQSIHIMGKAWLTSDACADFVKEAVNA
jgi:hypothetical protein